MNLSQSKSTPPNIPIPPSKSALLGDIFRVFVKDHNFATRFGDRIDGFGGVDFGFVKFRIYFNATRRKQHSKPSLKNDPEF